MLEMKVPADGDSKQLDLFSGVHPVAPGLIHYPVTTRFWRGVLRMHQTGGMGRHLRRACDWHVAPAWVLTGEPTCPDCLAYRDALRRMGYVRW